jgi:hypothetical protein
LATKKYIVSVLWKSHIITISRYLGNNLSNSGRYQHYILTMAIMQICLLLLVELSLVAIKPYYVVPKKYSIIPQQKQETEGMKEIIALPDYKIEIPSKKLIKCLDL